MATVEVTLVEPPIPVDLDRVGKAKTIPDLINISVYAHDPSTWQQNHWTMSRQYQGVGKVEHADLPFCGTMPSNTRAELILAENGTAILAVRGEGPENNRTISNLNPAIGRTMAFFIANGLLFGFAELVQERPQI